MSKRIFVLGGDGFCGWPTALHLSKNGNEVIIIDNLSRRNIDNELGANSLTPLSSMDTRVECWNNLTGKKIEFVNIDISKDYQDFKQLILSKKPDTIIHFAEQRAAPYSMKSPGHKIYTVDNNINATHNVLCAITECDPNIHLVHLGTMGVYGYGTAGMKIPEGYLQVEVTTDDGKKIEQDILYPTNPGSVYHMTKSIDQLLFKYYNKNDKLSITDLHQGIVWGTNTEETAMDEKLINRFDYDGDYGTVLNRFLMQSAIGYPLTVHGTGGQTRAFIHIKDTVRCVQLAVDNPPQRTDRVKILNQMTETHRVVELAKLISKLTGAEIAYVPNPRNEDAENDLHVKNDLFIELGLNPTTLEDGLLLEVTEIAKKYKQNADLSKIPATSTWTKNQSAGIPDMKITTA